MPTALYVPGLTDLQKLVLLALTDRANAEHGNSTFVGQGRIAADLGKGRSSVNKAMGVLEEAGYITRQPNYRKTDDGRAYRSSDTTVIHYAAMQAAIDAAAVENPHAESTEMSPPSALTALPLELSEHGGSALTALGVVLSEHGGSALARQQNREVNRELNQEPDWERETRNAPSAVTASGDRPQQAMHQLPQDLQDEALHIIRQLAQQPSGAQDLELLDDLIRDYITDEGRDLFLETWSIPAAAANDYEAKQWFGKFMNSMRRYGYLEDRRTAA